MWIGRQCISAEDEQETKFKDIILIMEMLTNLMSKDLLGFNKGIILQYVILIA